MAKYLTEEDLLNELRNCLEKKKVSNKLCNMFYLIAKNLAVKYPSSYEDRNDMVQKAVECCIRYWKNIDLELNVFAYFTQICKHSFYYFYNEKNKDDEFLNTLICNAGQLYEKKYKNK